MVPSGADLHAMIRRPLPGGADGHMNAETQTHNESEVHAGYAGRQPARRPESHRQPVPAAQL